MRGLFRGELTLRRVLALIKGLPPEGSVAHSIEAPEPKRRQASAEEVVAFFKRR